MADSLTIRLDDELAAQLERVGRQTGLSRGRLVRDALRRHLGSGPGRGFQVLSSYQGSLAGPSDLSTHRKHLAGFGRPRRK